MDIAECQTMTLSPLPQQARYEHNTAVIAFYLKKIEISHMNNLLKIKS